MSTPISAIAGMASGRTPVASVPAECVDDIEAALDAASKQVALVAHPPLEIPGKGTFAI
jgi:hypothetical protein